MSVVAELEPVFGPDEETMLIERCQAGDRLAFEEIFNLYRDDVFRFAYLVVRDSSLAQDVVQEAFLKVFRSIHKFQFRSSFKSWLYRVAVNEAITILRRRRIKEDLDPTPDASRGMETAQATREWQPEEAVLESEERRLLRGAIGQLDPVHRTVVVLKYFDEFSDTEIAAVIGCPPGTVKSRLHRARELLRNAMARQMGRPDLVALSYARLSNNPA
ncbi:MAG TPA: sigma-70 family RNA polymerase sigma factor [Symbiobacteriaceae bacterium]|nr:sigma-70 family RNA polymerase sigma factor [Symbiobacteriaceae bacterium]